MRCTTLIYCNYSQFHDRTINVVNFTAEDLKEAVKKATEVVKGYDRKVLALLVNKRNEVLSIDKEYRLSTQELLSMAS